VPEELKQQPDLKLGSPGEPCEECGAPLAADQRYCLNCGHRRGGPRVDYRAVMANGALAQPAQPEKPQTSEQEAPGKGGKPERDYAPLAAVGGIAVLGLMLLVGVLIGKGDSSSSAPSTPSVVRVTGEGGEGEGGGAGGLGGSKNGGAKGAKGGKGKAAGEDTSGIEASSGELEALQNETGEDAAKKALELPNEIATPGEPPPIDKSKPPAGGEKGITIE
jgi:hypothetical protein